MHAARAAALSSKAREGVSISSSDAVSKLHLTACWLVQEPLSILMQAPEASCNNVATQGDSGLCKRLHQALHRTGVASSINASVVSHARDKPCL
jgi:hypothetical protein